jgi:hypothetical protein
MPSARSWLLIGGYTFFVAAGDAVAGLSGQCRQPAHERAADAQDMDVHARRF